MADSSELKELFQRKTGELREKNFEEWETLWGELLDWTSRVMEIHPSAGDTVWETICSQIQHIAQRQGISEEQVINDLFTSGSAESFMLTFQLGSGFDRVTLGDILQS